MVEVLLQRTRAKQVVPVFEEFRRQYPTAVTFGEATEPELATLLAPLGLRWRVPLLARLAAEIGRRRGRLSRDAVNRVSLPAVGPYASSAALSLHGNRAAGLIDANTVRLTSRVFGTPYGPETRRTLRGAALFERLTPEDDHRAFNYGLLDLAMTVCTPCRPDCLACPLADLCEYIRGRSESLASDAAS